MAKYKGRNVTLNKPFRTPNASKKFGVYVRDQKTNNVKLLDLVQREWALKKIILQDKKVSLQDLDLY